MDPIDELLQAPAFGAAAPDGLFLRAVQQCRDILVRRFPRYAEHLRQAGSDPSAPITSAEQAQAVPSIFLPVLKSYSFPLPGDVAITQQLTSSGTTGRPSITPLDEVSMQRRVAAMLASYRGANIVAGSVEVLAFLIDPAQTQMAGSVVIDAALRATPDVRSIHYLARRGSAGPDFPLREAIEALQQAAARGPLLLVGYPALMGVAMQAMMSAGLRRLPLPAGSKVLTGGGWKSFLPGVPLERDDFQERVAAFFDLPRSQIRDMYGLSECPAIFLQCEKGQYHVPRFAWAQALDPESGAEMPAGAIGLLQLTVPLTTSYPLLKILTTDKVSMQADCSCGRKTQSLQPRGRTTAARFETCAMKMSRA